MSLSRSYLFIFLLNCFGVLNAQDAYHTDLQAFLASEYQLPAASYVIANTENSYLNATYNWGSQRTVTNISGQPFTRQARLNVTTQGANIWDAGFFATNTATVNEGDKLLWTFYVRSEGGNGNINIVAENTTTFDKEVFSPLPIGINWTRYFIAFEVLNGNYAPGALGIGFHLGQQVQDVRFGGITVLNYGPDVELSDLPSDFSPGNYDGNAPDAPWRGPAADRIDQLRKANLTINATDAAGNPVTGAIFSVEMQQHEFAFGTAVKASRFPGNPEANIILQNKLVNLDGNGHGFNWVVFENDLKWPAWEDNWFVSNAQLANAVTWLRSRNIKIRGHNLLWPGQGNLPNDVFENRNDTAYVLNRINEHIETVANYPGIAGEIEDWDVINETVTNTSLENSFRGQGSFTTGRELYSRVFEKTRLENPNAKLYLNDYVTISTQSLPSSASYQALKRNLGEIVANAPIDGIGFQGHVGATPNGIPSVLATYDDFYNSFGLEAKVTEFDLPTSVPEDVAAKYLGDFLTATFSHPSMNGFMFWNFWDVDTWLNAGSNLFNENWSQTQPGDMFIEKVFNEWWTNEEIESNSNGVAAIRGFKGSYEVTYVCGGETITETVSLSEDQTLDIQCDNFLSEVNEFDNRHNFTVSPNPNYGQLTIKHPFADEVAARLVNSLGQQVWSATVTSQFSTVNLSLPAGSYVLQLKNGQRWASQRVIMQ